MDSRFFAHAIPATYDIGAAMKIPGQLPPCRAGARNKARSARNWRATKPPLPENGAALLPEKSLQAAARSLQKI
jgi:hypothetical protein